MKNYIGFSLDHSGSMSSITKAAARDYNNNIDAIKENAIKQNQDTIVSVVKCGVGVGAKNVREVVNSSVIMLQTLDENYGYVADGSATPLFDSVGELIEMFEQVPDGNDRKVSFLIMVITDGIDNASYKWKYTLGRKIVELQSTDRWTFVFRVPHPTYSINYKQKLIDLGIPSGNILEWEQTEKGVEKASIMTRSAFDNYYTARSKGFTSTQNFYTTDLSEVLTRTVKSKLIDISNEVEFIDVTKRDNGKQIRNFVEWKRSEPMKKGSAFYQLTKTESQVQDYKQIAIRDKKTKSVYSGANARSMLGLPYNGTVKIVPGNHGAYDIFIQSTSVNRKLVEGTQLMYWDRVGVDYQS